MIRFFQGKKPTTTDVGRYGEAVAAKYLKKKGYRILAQNLHEGRNELDLVAEDGEWIVFIEVKTRSVRPYVTDYGTPADAVTSAKRRRTIAAAGAYLCKCKRNKTPRFDVIEVYLGEASHTQAPEVLHIEHLEDAFRS